MKKIKYLTIFLASFVNILSGQVPVFNMGDTTFTNLCSGILYDSGGKDGDYEFEEDFTFTICPTENPACIAIEVLTYDIENPFDLLFIYEGTTIDGVPLKTINKVGFNNLIYLENKCATIQFTSDATQERAGFELSWECLAECPILEAITVESPHSIANIPFQIENLSTCFAGNNLETGPCSDDRFLLGDDYIFAYESSGDECITVVLEGMVAETGLSIFRENPTTNTVKCVSQKQTKDTNRLTIPHVPLQDAGTYYFVVANQFNCTPFDLSIFLSDKCPETFPSAANCSDALILNGCSPDLPVALQVEPAVGAVDFFQKGINNGCWELIFGTNYTWFALEAQADGEFAFLLSNNDSTGLVDIDFNIWGPFDDTETACARAKNTQPVRSSWADDMLYSQTGLTHINPDGDRVMDTCEGLEGDGFLQPLTVQKGEVYMVLINDYDGVIFEGAILLDFSGTDPEVLRPLNEELEMLDTTVCLGEGLQLVAPKAAIYEWDREDTLSCFDCPSPLVTPSETTTYSVKTTNLCTVTTTEFEVTVKPSLVPNVFTPNDDGINDYFNVFPNQTAEVIEVFKVYNRWGTLVYDNDDAANGWNGYQRNSTNAKEQLPSGVYIYIIQFRIDEVLETAKGNVTLLR